MYLFPRPFLSLYFITAIWKAPLFHHMIAATMLCTTLSPMAMEPTNSETMSQNKSFLE
jgi:hypothetical protein